MNPEQKQEHEPKISMAEGVILLVLAIIADLFNWIPLLGTLISFGTLAFFQLYFLMKGVRGIWSFAGNLMEFFPVVSLLPAATGGVLATLWLDRQPPKVVGQLAGQSQTTKPK